MPRKIRVESFSFEMDELTSGSYGRHEGKALSDEDILYAEHFRALYIAHHPDIVVMQEGLSHEISTRTWKAYPLMLMDSIQRLFPGGMPTDVHALDKKQKDLLVGLGAAKTMQYLGRIETIYPLLSTDIASPYLQINKLAEKQSSYEVVIALFHRKHYYIAPAEMDMATLGNIHSMVYVNAVGEIVGQSNYEANHSLVHGGLRSPMIKLNSKDLMDTTMAFSAVGSFALAALVLWKCCKRRARPQASAGLKHS
ncbi:MAG: hypothetical protein Q7V63_07005 [Gammaproteobacteria bacterium]|nr:hypothetical protein [Gammaproteobacteria bacterium]